MTGPGDARPLRARSAVRPTRLDPGRLDRLRAAERRIAGVTRFLDDLVEIPGTRHRVGADAVVGLIPGVGDLVTAAVGGWIVLEASRFGLPRVVIARMVLNTLADLAIGAVPLLGDVVDVAFRSNRANLELLRRHAANPEASTRGDQAVVAGIVLIAVGLVVLVLMALGALLAIEIPPP